MCSSLGDGLPLSLLVAGWNAVSNLLYVDQPAGTGFSFVRDPLGYETNERQIATELWDFVRKFYQLYPKYSFLDLYVFGESYGQLLPLPLSLSLLHLPNVPCLFLRVMSIVFVSVAGHYVPATGQVIVESNSIYARNLKGIGIGNGWVDPYLQYPAYAEV